MLILCTEQQINSQLYTANERAELRKAIVKMLLSYGLTYKKERIEQQTAHPYSTSPGGAGKWRCEAPGEETGSRGLHTREQSRR